MSFTRKLPMFAGVAIIGLLAFVPFISAQNNDEAGSGLQISPTRSEISAQPGEVKEFTYSVRNITNGTIDAKAFLNDFESDNVSGTPQIITDNSQRTPNSLDSMLKGLTDLELKAGETKQVTLTLDVPGNAAPGAYFGAVRYAAVPKDAPESETDRQVSLTASVAHLVFLEVAGDVTEQIQVESLNAQLDGKSSWFFINQPNQTSVGIKNLGNGFSRPFGKVTTNNMFGKEVNSYEVNNTEPKGIILPNSSRTFTDGISGVSMPGRYTQVAAVAYGNGGEVVTYKNSFWYMPIWTIIVLLLLVAGVAYGGYRLYQNKFSSKKK